MGMETAGELVQVAKSEECARIAEILRRNSYRAGDGVRVNVVKLEALLRLIGVPEDDVRSAVASVR